MRNLSNAELDEEIKLYYENTPWGYHPESAWAEFDRRVESGRIVVR